MTSAEWIILSQNLLAAGVARGTPILYATLGEILSERAGVLNIGLEGIMLTGAASGVLAAHATGSVAMGLCAAVLAGAALALLHALVTVVLSADQVVSGLAIVFLGTGLAAVLGAPLVELGSQIPHLEPIHVPILGDIPLLGPILFQHNLLVFVVGLLAAGLYFFVRHTRYGLELRAVGENPEAAQAMGIPVRGVRVLYVTIGGGFSGLAGASLSLAVTPGWVEGMTAGQGWIAVGLTIFARWDPRWAVLGAVMFGVVRRLPLDLQGTDLPFFADPNVGYFLGMLPYLITIVVLVLAARSGRRGFSSQPAALGKPLTS